MDTVAVAGRPGLPSGFTSISPTSSLRVDPNANVHPDVPPLHTEQARRVGHLQSCDPQTDEKKNTRVPLRLEIQPCKIVSRGVGGGSWIVTRVATSTDPPSTSNQYDSLMLAEPAGGGNASTSRTHTHTHTPPKHWLLLGGQKVSRERCTCTTVEPKRNQPLREVMRMKQQRWQYFICRCYLDTEVEVRAWGRGGGGGV